MFAINDIKSGLSYYKDPSLDGVKNVVGRGSDGLFTVALASADRADQKWGTNIYGNGKSDGDLPKAAKKSGIIDGSKGASSPIADFLLGLAELFNLDMDHYYSKRSEEKPQIQTATDKNIVSDKVPDTIITTPDPWNPYRRISIDKYGKIDTSDSFNKRGKQLLLEEDSTIILK